MGPTIVTVETMVVRAVFQCFLDAGEGEILRVHRHLQQGGVRGPGDVQGHGEDGPGGAHQ